MTSTASAQVPEAAAADRRLPILLAMAMFVLVVDTSIMNVSISAVVSELNTTVSRVQSAIALEALGLGRVHPDRQQGRRPHRAQAGLRAGPAGLRRRRPGDGPGPERHRDLHLLGGHRRSWRVAPAAGHAVAHPRQLRGRCPEADVRPGRCGRGHRRRGRAAARRLHHDLPVLPRRLPAGGRRHRGRPVGASGSSRTCPTRAIGASTWSARSCRSWGWAVSCSASSPGRREPRRSGSCW